MERIDGRKFNQLRPLKITPNFVEFAEGSVLIECGRTKVLCCASVEEGAPRFRPAGTGWVTAEYAMLPRANRDRKSRDISRLKLSPRSAEIQRLIGRSLRAAVDLRALGDRTITVDCDVLQGDGGTRTASVTGGFLAMAMACQKLMDGNFLTRNPVKGYVAAVSAGIVDDELLLDLCYEEDSRAMVDFNCVMNDDGEIIEVQGTGEDRSYTMNEQQDLVRICAKGIKELIALQREALGGWKK